MADCLFCAIVAGEVAAHRVLDEPAAVAFLDARPVFKGHVLVVPRVHRGTLTDMPADDLGAFFGVVQRIAGAVQTGLGAAGTFVALNNTVSQSVPHLHVHVVPRNRKDGLRGFFWPRTKYADDAEAADFAARIRAALQPTAPRRSRPASPRAAAGNSAPADAVPTDESPASSPVNHQRGGTT